MALDEGGPRYNELMAAARATNASRDVDDRKAGMGTPKEWGFQTYFGVALLAIQAGVVTEDWHCVAEGLAMMEDIAETLVRANTILKNPPPG